MCARSSALAQVKARIRAKGSRGENWFHPRKTEWCRSRARVQNLWMLHVAGFFLPLHCNRTSTLRSPPTTQVNQIITHIYGRRLGWYVRNRTPHCESSSHAMHADAESRRRAAVRKRYLHLIAQQCGYASSAFIFVDLCIAPTKAHREGFYVGTPAASNKQREEKCSWRHTLISRVAS